MTTRASTTEPVLSPKRDHLLATAQRLFYRDGYRAVGIDTVLAEAGVAKMTLYHHFRSKEELIIAVLQQRSAALLAGVEANVAAAGRSPQKRLGAVFDGLAQWFASEDFKGCAFIRALSEYPEPAHPIHQAAWAHKRRMNALVRGILEDANVKDPSHLADTISLLMDGAIVAAHATGSTQPAESARAAALALLRKTGARTKEQGA